MNFPGNQEMVSGLHILMNVFRQTCAVDKTLYFLTGG